MGDLKISEGFLDAIMIRVTATGLAATGLVPTCTVMKLSDGATVGLTVAELTLGVYKVTDWAPNADTEYMTIWAVAGAYTIYAPFKLFKVGGGDVQAIFDLVKAAGAGDVTAILVDTGTTIPGLIAALNDLAQADILSDATPFDGADIAAILVDTGTTIPGLIAALNDLAQADILSDATPFDGADIAAILVDTDATIPALIAALENISAATVEAECIDAIESFDLDHLINIAHPTGDPVADSLLDLIMNKGAGQTFNRATDSLEALAEAVAAVGGGDATEAKQDTIIALLDSEIADIIADIGVFPSANYATLAAYVEDIRSRLIVILADVTGLNGDVMRGTDGAALAANWTAALATILGNFTAIRIGYLDELDFDLQGTLGSLDTLIDGIIADIGVFPTANYATLAAYVEDIRTRLIAILADVTGLAGDAMRGTDGAALVASGWDAALATILDNFTAGRIGNLDELDFDLQATLNTIAGYIDAEIAAIIADIGVFPTANYATLAAYVEDIRTRLIAIVADTGAIAWGDITGIINDIGVFPTANYATLAAYVEDIRAKLITIDGIVDDILVDTGTTLENRQDAIRSDQIEANERAFLRRYPFVTTNESVSNAAEVSLAAPAVVTPTFPTGSTRLNSYVVAILKVNNQTAAEHNIGVTLQKNIAAGGWVDVRDFTASPPLTLPAVDATADSVTFIEPVSVTTGQSVQFRFQVDSDDAGEVHYTQVFFFALEYDFQ